jgi:hypothetical protein
MKSSTDTRLVIAFVVVVALFLLFGGGAVTGGTMNGGMNGGMHGTGWLDERGWMWTPALLALGLGVVLGWVIFRKKG